MRARSGESGYNMVMLIVAITVLNIAVAAVLPLASTDIQRQKEEELVFRGFQYAEAIRLFHNRFQRYPVKLTEMVEMKPRCIRQLWKDPMTRDGKWGLIYLNQVGPLVAQPGPNNPNPNGPNPNSPNPNNPNPNGPDPNGQTSDSGDGGLNIPKNGEVVATGPIIGVYSKSAKKSHLIFFGHEHYNEWQFTENLLTGGAPASGGGGPAGVGGGGGGGRLAFSIRWLGRPMPFFDQSQPLNGSGPNPTGPPTPTTTKTTKTSGKP